MLDLNDVSAERKTAEQLLPLMQEAIHKMESQYGVKVVAFVTDSSGEAKKARKLLGQERPDLVVPPCYSHQVCSVFFHVVSRKT